MQKIAYQNMRDNLKFDKGVCPELIKLMLRCFKTDPGLRPSVDEILTLPMFSHHVFRRRCVFYM